MTNADRIKEYIKTLDNTYLHNLLIVGFGGMAYSKMEADLNINSVSETWLAKPVKTNFDRLQECKTAEEVIDLTDEYGNSISKSFKDWLNSPAE